MSLSALLQGAQNWTQHYRCTLTSAKQRAVTISNCWFHSWERNPVAQDSAFDPLKYKGHIADSHSVHCPPGPRSPYPQNCFLASQFPSHLHVGLGLLCSGCGAFYLLMLKFVRFLLAGFSRLLIPLWIAVLPSSCSPRCQLGICCRCITSLHLCR